MKHSGSSIILNRNPSEDFSLGSRPKPHTYCTTECAPATGCVSDSATLLSAAEYGLGPGLQRERVSEKKRRRRRRAGLIHKLSNPNPFNL